MVFVTEVVWKKKFISPHCLNITRFGSGRMLGTSSHIKPGLLDFCKAYYVDLAWITRWTLYLCSLSSCPWPLLLLSTVPMSRHPGAGIAASRFHSTGSECMDRTLWWRDARSDFCLHAQLLCLISCWIYDCIFAERLGKGTSISTITLTESLLHDPAKSPLTLPMLLLLSLFRLICSHTFNMMSIVEGLL